MALHYWFIERFLRYYFQLISKKSELFTDFPQSYFHKRTYIPMTKLKILTKTINLVALQIQQLILSQYFWEQLTFYLLKINLKNIEQASGFETSVQKIYNRSKYFQHTFGLFNSGVTQNFCFKKLHLLKDTFLMTAFKCQLLTFACSARRSEIEVSITTTQSSVKIEMDQVLPHF